MEYISRKRVLRVMDDWWRTSIMADGKPTLDALIRAIPPEDVVPVIHGSWIDLSNGECDDFGRPYVYVKCSECGETAIKYSDYCPHCGAKMDKEEE